MECNRIKKDGFTLVEMMIAVLIMAFIAAFMWRIYSNGGETMRHTVSQSQLQADIRQFLDRLESEMMTCYAFNEIDSENKKFSFYSYTYSKNPLERIYYDESGEIRDISSEDSEQSVKVKKIEYSWKEDGTVTKTRTPGWLYFLRNPMVFKEDNSNVFDNGDKAMTKVILRDIKDLEVKGYKQKIEMNEDNEVGYKVEPVVSEEDVPLATFIVLRLHAYKGEGGRKRDEEIDVVTKYYSSIRIADITYR